MADALEILAADHRAVLSLLQTLGSTAEPEKRQELAEQVVSKLANHAQIEQKTFYPAVADRIDGGKGFVSVSREEHDKAKQQMDKLSKLKPEDPWFAPALGELTKLVKEHVADEEMQLFPRVRAAFDAAELAELGERLEKKRKPVRAR
jgi:hemerythrin superfamily protein